MRVIVAEKGVVSMFDSSTVYIRIGLARSDLSIENLEACCGRLTLETSTF